MATDTSRTAAISSFALLIVLAALLVSRVTAQSPGDGGLPTPPSQVTGKLKASGTAVGLGDSIEVTAYDVSPVDVRVNLVVSGPLRYGSCDSAEDSSAQTLALLFESPVTVALTACGPVGVATVRLEGTSGVELASPMRILGLCACRRYVRGRAGEPVGYCAGYAAAVYPR